MPRRKRASPQPVQAPPKPEGPTVTIPRLMLQAFHSCARALFRDQIRKDNHSAEAVAYLSMLDALIDDGHTILGTDRSSADQYVHVIGGLTQVQVENARKILQSEGLLDPLDNS